MIILTETTMEMQQAAKTAAQQRYQYNRWTPNRAGWHGGKCPVTEYFGILAELGAADFLGYDWHDVVLFSTNPADFTAPDIDDWEIKAGSTFSKKDIAKGAKRILWVTPWDNGYRFECGYDTCAVGHHKKLSGLVEIRGWTDLALDDYADFGGYFKPSNMHNAVTLAQAVAA